VAAVKELIEVSVAELDCTLIALEVMPTTSISPYVRSRGMHLLMAKSPVRQDIQPHGMLLYQPS
jgi:hypothetical protein